MSSTAGPKVVNDSIAFSIDAANYKSFGYLSTVETLVVAGGGSGGVHNPGGGGGGGVVYTPQLTIVSGTSYSITVGNGGQGQIWGTSGNNGYNGQNSSFGALITAIGGGGGGGGSGGAGNTGGSGGGGSLTTGGAGTAGQGFAGGTAYSFAGGGGGGASQSGANGSTNCDAGKGGDGFLSSITGTATWYGGGGGGATISSNPGGYGGFTSITGAAGLGGATPGHPNQSANATANTGGGSGGADRSPGTSGNGGSGVVIVKYPGTQRATGGTITFVNGYTIHTFTSSGTFDVSYASGTWMDMSGNNRDGVITNGATYTTENNGVFTFNGSNSYIITPTTTISTPSGGTMEMWVNITAKDRNQGFFSISASGTYINFYMPASTNTMRWEVIGNVSNFYAEINSTTVFDINRWYYVVGTYNGTNISIYINGIMETTLAMANQPTSVTAPVIVGNYAGVMLGKIPNAKFYTRCLTAAEIQQNFNALRGRYGV